MRRGRIGKFIGSAAFVLGIGLAIVGALIVLKDGRSAQSYRDLASYVASGVDSVSPETANAEEIGEQAESLVDWEALLAQNGETCAWLNVAGTTVDVPVLRSYAEDPERWLYKDIWGNHSDTGVPYLDYRCEPDGETLVVYGHRTLYESYLFHDISPVYQQETFDSLSNATWVTQGDIATFEPLCAASVSMSDGNWQRFSFGSYEEMREWLGWAAENSGARSADVELLAASARRVLILVTCNGRIYYPTTRTIAVFVSPFPSPDWEDGVDDNEEGGTNDASASGTQI